MQLEDLETNWTTKIRPCIFKEGNSSLQSDSSLSTSFSESVRILGVNKFTLLDQKSSFPMYWFSNHQQMYFKMEIVIKTSISQLSVVLLVTELIKS